MASLQGQWRADRPNMAYYIDITLRKAHAHVHGNKPANDSSAASSSAARVDVRPPQAPAEAQPVERPAVEAAAVQPPPQPDLAMVQRLVDAALDARLPRAEEQSKKCIKCEASKLRGRFSSTEWIKKDPTCLDCKPVDERFQKRLKATKICVDCQKDVPKDDFSASQWQKGTKSKCKRCVAKSQVQQQNLTKVCRACNEGKAKDCFSQTQWDQPKSIGSQRIACSKKAEEASHFVKQEAAVEAQDAASETETKEDMLRYLNYCPLVELPSVNVKTYRAMKALGGRSGWQTATPKPSDTVPVDEKVRLLLAAHQDLNHLGGREGLVQALKADGALSPTPHTIGGGGGGRDHGSRVHIYIYIYIYICPYIHIQIIIIDNISKR